MKEVFDKISSYNLLNYLIPGAIFWYLSPVICDIKLPLDSIVGELVGFYFVGMIIYCVGSVLIEPIFRKLHILHFTSYSQFVIASSSDPHLVSLSESNNTFRTIMALCFLLIVTKLYCDYLSFFNPWGVIIGLFVLFSAAYIKRTLYINKRIPIILDELEAKKADEN